MLLFNCKSTEMFCLRLNTKQRATGGREENKCISHTGREKIQEETKVKRDEKFSPILFFFSQLLAKPVVLIAYG